MKNQFVIHTSALWFVFSGYKAFVRGIIIFFWLFKEIGLNSLNCLLSSSKRLSLKTCYMFHMRFCVVSKFKNIFLPSGFYKCLNFLSCRFLDPLVMFIWKGLNSTESLFIPSSVFGNLSEGQYWAQNHLFLSTNCSHLINLLYLHQMGFGNTLAIRTQLI